MAEPKQSYRIAAVAILTGMACFTAQLPSAVDAADDEALPTQKVEVDGCRVTLPSTFLAKEAAKFRMSANCVKVSDAPVEVPLEVYAIEKGEMTSRVGPMPQMLWQGTVSVTRSGKPAELAALLPKDALDLIAGVPPESSISFAAYRPEEFAQMQTLRKQITAAKVGFKKAL